ncbi:hypothetical protein [Streptomyces sp. NPDC000618]|uniref:hypothetical protein n=1 Tax=Streptomyces sp. NPDC000618 TaxID=3154265 RepID=UPI0033332BBA
MDDQPTPLTRQQLDEVLPAWEAMYEPGNVSDYLIGYANDEAPARAAAEAWLRSQKDEVGRLEWVPQNPLDGYDQEAELIELHADGIDTGPGITIRHRVVAVPSAPSREELLDELQEARDELAEAKASQDPRLRCLLVKAAPDKDLYIGWSNICEMPAGVWSRETAIEFGFPASRLARADKNGSSDLSCGDGHWDDPGFVAEQRGWLRRDRLGDYAVEYLGGDRQAAFDLLEPFEGEAEVRR